MSDQLVHIDWLFSLSPSDINNFEGQRYYICCKVCWHVLLGARTRLTQRVRLLFFAIQVLANKRASNQKDGRLSWWRDKRTDVSALVDRPSTTTVILGHRTAADRNKRAIWRLLCQGKRTKPDELAIIYWVADKRSTLQRQTKHDLSLKHIYFFCFLQFSDQMGLAAKISCKYRGLWRQGPHW